MGLRFREILLIIAVSLAFRAGFVLPALVRHSVALGPPHLDTHEYYALAQSITRGLYEIGGVDWILRPPGYPAFLAAVNITFGADPRFAVALQVILGILIAILVAFWASETSGRTAGLAAGLFAGLAPVTGLLSGFLLAEAVFTSAVALGLFFFRKRPALSGFLLGLSALVKPTGIYPAVVAAGYHAVRKDWTRAGLLAIAFLVPVLPWLARNKIVNGKAILSTQHEATVFLYSAPYTMMQETGIGYEEALVNLGDTLGCEDLEAAPLDPGLAGELSRRGVAYMLRHPAAYAAAHLKGFVKGFYGLGREFTTMIWPNPLATRIIVIMSWLYALVVYILAIRGFLRLRGEGFALAITVFLLLFLPGADGSFRFRAPAEPILALAAGIGLASLIGKFRRP
ncbi:MAG: ArnT family glycosyltransferase [candidate division WOR-3 bacterium]